MNGHPGYSDPHRLPAWYNSNTAPKGQLFLTDDEAVTAERHRKDKAAKDEEARRHNHRIMHPIDEVREAAA